MLCLLACFSAEGVKLVAGFSAVHSDLCEFHESTRAHGVVVSQPLRMRKALGSNPSVSILLHRLAFLKSINADHAGSMAQECFPCHDWHAQQLKERTMDTLGIEPRASRMLSGCDATTPCAQMLVAIPFKIMRLIRADASIFLGALSGCLQLACNCTHGLVAMTSA